LKYGGRKALGILTGLVCGYFGSAEVVLITNSSRFVSGAKCVHSICSGGLDLAELCATTPMHAVEIVIFGRPVILDEGQGFDLFCSSPSDPIDIP
jgi:hypothetical protein